MHYSGDRLAPQARALQAFLNQFADVELADDGRLGARSSNAFWLVTGYLLIGDPRAAAPHPDFDHILAV